MVAMFEKRGLDTNCFDIVFNMVPRRIFGIVPRLIFSTWYRDKIKFESELLVENRFMAAAAVRSTSKNGFKGLEYHETL